MVTLSILDLLIFQIKASGEKVRHCDKGGISVYPLVNKHRP